MALKIGYSTKQYKALNEDLDRLKRLKCQYSTFINRNLLNFNSKYSNIVFKKDFEQYVEYLMTKLFKYRIY